MKKLSSEKINVLRKSVSTYLYVLDKDSNKDIVEYNLLEELYNELCDLTFNKGVE